MRKGKEIPAGTHLGRRSLGGRPSFTVLGTPIVGLLLTSFLVVGPWPIDSSDVSLPAARRAALAAFGSPGDCAPRECSASGPLFAGVGTAEITPPRAVPLAGIFDRCLLPNTGAASGVIVRVLALDNGHEEVFLVTADLLLVTRSLRERIVEKLATAHPDIAPERLYFTASHTHSGPGGWSADPFEYLVAGRPDAAFADWLADRFVAAIGAARKDLAPAELGHGAAWLENPYAITNRLVKRGPANRWVDVLALRDPQTKAPRATVVFLAPHALTRKVDDRLVSAEYPGVVRETIEATEGGLCLFASSSVGQMVAGDFGQPRGPSRMEAAGRYYARAVSELLPRLTYERRIAIHNRRVEVPLPQQQVRWGPTGLRFSPLVSRFFLPEGTQVHLLALGSVHLVGVGCDFSGTIGMALRDSVPGRTTLVTSFNGDYFGYVVPDESYDRLHYETMLMSFYGPRLGGYMTEILASASGSMAR